MALSSEAEGSQTATLGTEHTLATITTAGVYVLTVDANALVANEELSLRAYVKVLSGGASRIVHESTTRANAGLNNLVLIGVSVAAAIEVKYTLKQTNGTGRAFPWEVVDLGNTTVAQTASGTSAPADRTPGSEHTLATRTDGKTYVLYVDLAAATSTESVTLRLKTKVRTTGTTRLLWEMEIPGHLVSSSPIAMSPALPALNELVATLTETGGTERSYPWSLVSLD